MGAYKLRANTIDHACLLCAVALAPLLLRRGRVCYDRATSRLWCSPGTVGHPLDWAWVARFLVTSVVPLLVAVERRRNPGSMGVYRSARRRARLWRGTPSKAGLRGSAEPQGSSQAAGDGAEAFDAEADPTLSRDTPRPGSRRPYGDAWAACGDTSDLQALGAV